ncbi:HD domain-containing protein [Algoriphagus namhaensis]|uniref:HD domain-containing protein n=1 Tax=Algoriphagus namhaensis TaxID=915353 RepID=A0ABV8AQG7_9BACT
MNQYLSLRRRVLKRLREELPSHLTYHGIAHTSDVLHVCNQYIRRYNLSQEDRMMLKIGATVHDMGFLKSPVNHEETGANMAEQMMKEMGMSQKQVDIMRGLVMSTKIPQSPKTQLEEIICDADLDYLGRDDYPEISQRLFDELKFMGILKTPEDWKNLQINFLKSHSFHTPFAKKNREPKKQYWLNKLLNS